MVKALNTESLTFYNYTDMKSLKKYGFLYLIYSFSNNHPTKFRNIIPATYMFY
jgi:hypothetical protein